MVAAGTTDAEKATTLAGLRHRMDRKREELKRQLEAGGRVDDLTTLGSIEAPTSDRLMNVLAQRAQQLLSGTLEEVLVEPSIAILKKKQQEAGAAKNQTLVDQCVHLLSIFEHPEEFQANWQQRKEKVQASV